MSRFVRLRSSRRLTEDNDLLDAAVLGFCVIGNEKRFVNSCVDNIVNFIEAQRLAVLEDHEMEIVHYS